MKTPEEMKEYFRSMPKKKTENNPYWKFVTDPQCADKQYISAIIAGNETAPVDIKASIPTLKMVRQFFRNFYESFHSEAQVLCVKPEDGEKLNKIGVPILGKGQIDSFDVTVIVLPQDNHMGTSVISEWFWQNRIIGQGIMPIARIHSHHVLDPYQSSTDYSTLNSGTLEMVLGRIFEEELHLCYWLDVPGTDIKAKTFLAQETVFGNIMWISRQFNGAGTAVGQTMVCE